MNDRERFLSVMNYRPVDRNVYGSGMGAWPETMERWKTEGYDPADEPLFKTDHWEWIGGWFFPNPPFEHKVIEEDERTILYVNHEGILMRERKDNPYSSMPQFVKALFRDLGHPQDQALPASRTHFLGDGVLRGS